MKGVENSLQKWRCEKMFLIPDFAAMYTYNMIT